MICSCAGQWRIRVFITTAGIVFPADIENGYLGNPPFPFSDNNQCSEAEVCPSDKATPYFEYILKSESHPHKERASDA